MTGKVFGTIVFIYVEKLLVSIIGAYLHCYSIREILVDLKIKWRDLIWIFIFSIIPIFYIHSIQVLHLNIS